MRLGDEQLVNSFRLAIHLANQPNDAIVNSISISILFLFQISDLNPRVKIMNDEKLYEAWAKFRDERAKESGELNVCWIYAIFIVVLMVYSAFLIYLPGPDHAVIVQTEPWLNDSDELDVSTVEKDSSEITRGGYIPLGRFLKWNK